MIRVMRAWARFTYRKHSIGKGGRLIEVLCEDTFKTVREAEGLREARAATISRR